MRKVLNKISVNAAALLAAVLLWSCNSGINRDVLGMTIGETSLSDAEDVLKEHGTVYQEISEEGDAAFLIVENVTFANVEWDRVVARFSPDDDVLECVRFDGINLPYDVTSKKEKREGIAEIQSAILRALNEKYGEYSVKEDKEEEANDAETDPAVKLFGKIAKGIKNVGKNLGVYHEWCDGTMRVELLGQALIYSLCDNEGEGQNESDSGVDASAL